MARNYRILRVSSTAYLATIERLLADGPALANASFSRQMAAYFDQSLVYGDSFSRAMAALGNETMEVLSNAEIFQKTWAKQNGVRFDETNWVRDILNAQVESFRPDVIYIQGLTTDPSGFLPTDGFRQQFPFVKAVVGYTGFPHSADHLEGIDLVIAGIPSIRDYYVEHGIPCRLAYHGFDTNVPEKLDAIQGKSSTREIPLSFAGSSGFGFGESHRSRYWELVSLCFGTPLQLWTYDRLDTIDFQIPRDQVEKLGSSLVSSALTSPATEVTNAFREFCIDSMGGEDPAFPLSMLFPERCHEAVYGLDMYGVLNRSRITVNRHTDAIGGEVGNMRMFEATGVGCCMLVDAGSNLADLFEPDKEVVTYSSVEECIEKANWLLEHEEERAAIAQAGQQRTLRDHSMEQRCEAIHEMVSQLL